MRSFAWLLVLAVTCGLHGAELPPTRHAFTVIAHRGNHARAHENTLTALRDAVKAGIDYAEIDVRRTADGRYVLMHDSTVDRMTDGHGSISRMTLDQLRTLKVRDSTRPGVAPDHIPTFEEALAVIKGRINVYLDFKQGDRAVVAQAIRKAGVTRQVLVYGGPRAVPEWRKVAPELPLIVSPPESIKTPKALVAFAKDLGIEVLDADWGQYTPEMVSAAERAGIKVWPDIQAGDEGPAYFGKVVERGFTGAQTDHPQEFIAWLKKQKRR